MLFFGAVSVFILGSVWPILENDVVMAQLLTHLDSRSAEDGIVRRTEASMAAAVIILCVSAAIMLAMGILSIFCTTPNVHRVTSGSRRAARQGLASVPLRSDEASGLFWIGACVLTAGVMYAVIVHLALRNERFVLDPPLYTLVLPVVFVAVLLVFLQSGLERFGVRATLVSIFLLWMVPFFTAILLAGAFDMHVLWGYVAVPFPPASLVFMGLDNFWLGMPEEMSIEDAPPFVEHLGYLAMLPVLFYGGLAIPMATSAILRNRRIMRRALVEQGV